MELGLVFIIIGSLLILAFAAEVLIMKRTSKRDENGRVIRANRGCDDRAKTR